MDAGTRNRARLYLRGERAFGLSIVPRPAERVPEADETSAATEPVAARRQTATPPVRSSPMAQQPRPSRSHGAAPAPAPAPFDHVGRPNEMAPRGGLVPPPSVEPFAAPELSPDEKCVRLVALDENEVRGCTRCRLSQTRTNTVFGEGDANARIFIIGEGPGETEDRTGRPFVGKAGQLLDKMIAGMGLAREQVFIANIVKCRPPGNRVPMPDEVATCTPYLERQIEIVRPQVIVTLGLPAAKYMLNDPKLAMGRIRGQWRAWRGIKLMPTFHPAYILRQYTPEVRAAVWSDQKAVLHELGLPVPHR